MVQSLGVLDAGYETQLFAALAAAQKAAGHTVYFDANFAVQHSLTNNGGVAHTWDAMCGGVQWGYACMNADHSILSRSRLRPRPGVPESSSILFIGAALAAGTTYRCPSNGSAMSLEQRAPSANLQARLVFSM